MENGKLISKTVNGVDALEGGATSAGAIESDKIKSKRRY